MSEDGKGSPDVRAANAAHPVPARVPARARARLRVIVTDAHGRAVPDGGLARWLERLAPRAVRGEVAVALVSDVRMRALNRQYRGVDRATDVLSFAADPPPAGAARAVSTSKAPDRIPHGRHVGDIAIATGVARRQARRAGHSLATELRVLALHGFLHLVGYDHETDQGQMARTERRLRRRGGLGEGLVERGRAR